MDVARPQHVTLEPLSESHVAAVAELVEDPDVLRFTRVPEPPPAGFARIWLGRYETGRVDRTREGFAAVGPDGEFLGLALAPHIDAEAGEAELGYVVAPAARGRGVGTAILRELTRWAFQELGAHRVYLLIDVANAPSERIAQRCGYVREGVMRSVYVKPGRRGDTALWSRLVTDPDPG